METRLCYNNINICMFRHESELTGDTVNHMKNKLLLRALTAALTALLLCVPAAAKLPEESEYILSFSSAEARDEAMERGGFTILDTYDSIFAGMAVSCSNPALLSSLDGVLSVEEVREHTVLAEESAAFNVGLTPFGGDAPALDYRGEGMVVAVLDSAFDVTHPAFVLSDEENLMLDAETVTKLIDSHMNVANYYRLYPDESPYYSAKLPFVFDYYDTDGDVSGSSVHGTHVAGIIGANKRGDPTLGFDGIAPEAQLLLLKVGNGSSSISDRAIFSAFDDAISLGADVINMSFGTIAGFDSLALTSYNYGYLFTTADALGIHVVCAAGNSGQVGEGSSYGTNLPLAINPDTGLIAEPASLKTTVAVAATESGWLVDGCYIEAPDGERIFFTESDGERGFGDTLAGGSYPLVKIPGIGEVSDYEGITLPEGAVVLVERGTITFEEKVKTAADHGAAAVIVSDNTEDDGFIMAVGDAPIPSASITKADGAILAKADRITVILDTTLRENEYAGQPADFSSGGATPDLKLKPELSAPGTYIRSTLPDGKYGSLSGTSMATPYVSGALALASQAWGEDAAIRLMATAIPMRDDKDVEYSPRSQGAGEIDLASALSCQLVMTSEKGTGKLELGELEGGSFDLTVRLINPTDEAVTGRISASLLSDDTILESGLHFISGTKALTGTVIRYNGSRNINIHHRAFREGAEITLEPGETKEITLTVTPGRGDTTTLEQIFTNGYFLEGYVYFETDAHTLSLPYMGFCGDWYGLPVIDTTDYIGDEGFYPQYAITCVVEGYETTYIRLEDNGGKVSFSPDGNGMGDTLGFILNPLRNADEYGYMIYDAEGKLICGNEDLGHLTKATVEEVLEGTAMELLWDGTEPRNENYIYPDGEYKLVLFILPDEYSDRYQYITLEFVIDTVKPEVTDYRFIEEGGKRYLEVEIGDDRGISYATLYQTGDGDFSEMITSPEGKLRFDVTGIEGTLWLDVSDHAMNITTEKIKN